MDTYNIFMNGFYNGLGLAIGVITVGTTFFMIGTVSQSNKRKEKYKGIDVFTEVDINMANLSSENKFKKIFDILE